MREPSVLTRMRLSCCWGDNLNEKELNEVVDYINYLQKQNTELKGNWNKLKEWLEEETIKLELYKDNIDIDEYVDKKFLLKKVLDKLQEIEGEMND